ncbi:hypothetical protein MLD38_033861 [Melastoma candidum]|uniref:Uncharacterized protein n=1 Tax=Melastoma candidum TaxID=119954 RepID=A0ACB9M9F8_9MYRT|nr:hypothetical protein MLD38_033861 [Melastoma candidum]
MARDDTLRQFKCPVRGLLCSISLFCFLILLLIGTSSLHPSVSYNPADYLFPEAGIRPSARVQVADLHRQVGELLKEIRSQRTEMKVSAEFLDRVTRVAISLDELAKGLDVGSSKQLCDPDEMSSVDGNWTEAEETEDLGELTGNHVFLSGEIRGYMAPKPNRIAGKKIFLGVEAILPSVGMGCTRMASSVDRYANYKIYDNCPDDSDLVHKLMVGGCDPLPRRRCFARIPEKYVRRPPMDASLWAPPSHSNIRWTHYKCKDYSCLVSDNTVGKRGFFKCSECFNLSRRGWEVPADKKLSAEFTLDEVLALKPGEIRMGLDFSPTTGTFAALMRERNVTIASATLNLGAPFNEVIASRGLIPLYISVGSRLPFYDNTLDIIHTTLFLDGWIDVELLQFVLFDWDRVLRPEGLLWVDGFFCKKADIDLYIGEFGRLRYRKLMWSTVPKNDTNSTDEIFFSAVLEKPIRR